MRRLLCAALIAAAATAFMSSQTVTAATTPVDEDVQEQPVDVPVPPVVDPDIVTVPGIDTLVDLFGLEAPGEIPGSELLGSVGAEGATGATGADEEGTGFDIAIDLGGDDGPRVPSQSVVLIIMLTLIAVAPSLLIMLTSFTRIVIVFSLLRNAIGLPQAPPNQVIVGLSLLLTLFVMGPTLSDAWDNGVVPYTEGTLEQSEAFDAAMLPFRTFMAANVGDGELELMLAASGSETAPSTPEEVPLTALIPAFVLSEIKTAFLIGFIVFVPFLIIDLVTSASLMSLGMMMMPPPMVSLPLKLLLLVMVDGWVLVTETLITGFNT